MSIVYMAILYRAADGSIKRVEVQLDDQSEYYREIVIKERERSRKRNSPPATDMPPKTLH